MDGTGAPGPVVDRPVEPDRAAGQQARQEALARLRQRRAYLGRVVGGLVGLVALVVIWAVSEYHNAGGWPTRGFSQSSGIHDVWNFWILYPALAWLLLVGIDTWLTYLRKPITERDAERELRRQGGRSG